MAVYVRRVQSIAEYQAIQQVQRQVFGFGSHDTVMHLPLMVALQKNGGLVLGAFAAASSGAEELVGFALGFIGRDAKTSRYFHYSEVVAALSEWQSQGVGLMLKAAQRREAMTQGFGLMRWTFDPLLARNAYFNLVKLGGVCREYVPDMYGQGQGDYLGQLATDRLVVDWELTAPGVVERLSLAEVGTRPALPVAAYLAAPNVVHTHLLAVNVPAITAIDLSCTAPQLRLEIPHQYKLVRDYAAEAAQDWRNQTRLLFKHYLAKGYYAADFFTHHDGDTTRAFYLLQTLAKR